MKLRTSIAILLTTLGASGSVFAESTPDEIKKLGSSLTVWGAEAGANADGSIPAYVPGGVKPPASYDPSKPGFRPDPYANEKPVLTITAANMAQYAGKLTEGVKEMLKKYPTFRMDVYPTHRTASYPKYILDNTMKNAATCKLADSLLQLAGTCYGGVPFPIPKNGAEVMWNRTMKYDQYAYQSPSQTSTMVTPQGKAVLTGAFEYWQTFPLNKPGRTTPIANDEIIEYGRVDWTGPTRKAGEILVLHDAVDMVGVGRLAWSYSPGQRRVKLSPDVAYDTPSPAGGGIGTVDETQVFYGAQDRYNYKLVGKKEIYIPYNEFKIHDPQICSDEKVYTPHHLNPDCVRWELHRVWVVEATLKEGKRHVYPRRTIYWDEDIFAVGMSDNYDDAGKIYRVTWNHYYPFYETTGHNTHEFVVHDMPGGGYVRQAYTPAGVGMMVVTKPEDAKPASYYQPAAIAQGGVR
ncbi:MAG: DUF1329 domain-containing protein [Azonexus sp.]|jgi:hypothetical protein|nr:DUF1329 domain-containing protein [Azonexus sp.]